MNEDNAFELSDSDKISLLNIMIKERNKTNTSKSSYWGLRNKLDKETGHYYNVHLLDKMYESHQMCYMHFLQFGRLPEPAAQIMGVDLQFLPSWEKLFNDSEIPTNVRVEKEVFNGPGSHEHTLNIWKPEMGKPSRSGSRSTRSSASEGTSTQRFHPYGVDRDRLKGCILRRLKNLGVPSGSISMITIKLRANVDILDWIASKTDLNLLNWVSDQLNCAEMNNFVENWKEVLKQSLGM